MNIYVFDPAALVRTGSTKGRSAGRVRTSVRTSGSFRSQVGMLIASLLFVWMTACAPVAAEPVPTVVPSIVPTVTVPPAPALPSGWQTDASGQPCGFTISHPGEMQGSRQDSYSWLITPTVSDPEQAARNFIYVTAVPHDFQSGTEIAYNFDPAGADLLLNLQLGEAKSVHSNPDVAQWFTFTRRPDITIGDQVMQTYENTQPWEFPPGTKELRYFLKTNDCTYQFGGYVDTAGSTQPGAISEDLFNSIILTFQAEP